MEKLLNSPGSEILGVSCNNQQQLANQTIQSPVGIGSSRIGTEPSSTSQTIPRTQYTGLGCSSSPVGMGIRYRPPLSQPAIIPGHHTNMKNCPSSMVPINCGHFGRYQITTSPCRLPTAIYTTDPGEWSHHGHTPRPMGPTSCIQRTSTTDCDKQIFQASLDENAPNRTHSNINVTITGSSSSGQRSFHQQIAQEQSSVQQYFTPSHHIFTPSHLHQMAFTKSHPPQLTGHKQFSFQQITSQSIEMKQKTPTQVQGIPPPGPMKTCDRTTQQPPSPWQQRPPVFLNYQQQSFHVPQPIQPVTSNTRTQPELLQWQQQMFQQQQRAEKLIMIATTRIVKACLEGDYSLIVSLIEDKVDVNCTENIGEGYGDMSPLIAASSKGRTSIVTLLIEHGAQVNLQINNGFTALMLASQNGHSKAIQVLLKNGASVDLQNNNGFTALILASQNGHSEAIQLLLQNGASVNLRNNHEGTPLMAASLNGHSDAIQVLLKSGAGVDLQTNSGDTALMLASQNGHSEAVQVLLKTGASVDLQNSLGSAALKLASLNGHFKATQALLKNRASVDLQSNNGFTALMAASQNGHSEIIQVLLMYGASVDLPNNVGVTALMIASLSGHSKVIQVLLMNGASIDLQSKSGCTALMFATEKNETETAKELLKYGAKTDLKTKDGKTAMYMARSKEMVDLLMLAMIPKLVELLQPIATKWIDFGRSLGLNEATLNTCQTVGKEDHLKTVMNIWLNQENPHSSWKTLIRAVKSLDTSIAQKLDKLVHPLMRTGKREDTDNKGKLIDHENAEDENKAKHLAAVEKAMKEKGKLEHTLVHGCVVGPAGSGKSSLITRLVGEMPSSTSPSTGVANKVVQIVVRRSSSVTAFVCNSSWLKILYDEEAVRLMMLASSVSSSQNLIQKQPITVPDQPFPLTDNSTSTLKNVQAHGTSFSSPKTQVPDTSSSSPKTQNTTNTPKSTTVNVPLPTGYVAPIGVFKNALQKGRLEELQKRIEKSWSLYLTDSGGQMEFQEVLPLLVSGPSIFFITFRLDQDLLQQFMIEYRLPDGGRSKPYQSTLTLEEAILQTLASVASMGTFTYQGPEMESVPLKPKVFIVGTHKDLLQNTLGKAGAESKIKEIDEYLQTVIKSTSHYREDLVEFASEFQLIYTVNNLSEDDSDFEKIRSGVQRAVDRNNFKLSFPSHWLVFSLVLRQEMIKDGIISYSQCFAIAKDCGIATCEELNHALWFLHTKVGLIRHFPTQGLSDFVVRDPQILFDQVTHLIVKTFTFESVGKQTAEEFKKKGIFSFKDFLSVSKNLSSNELPPEKMLELLEQLRIVAPFEEDGHTKYFIPCVLAHSEMCHSQSLTKGFNIPRLLLSFKCGYCPKGLYGALLVYLLTNEMESKFKWKLKTDQIFRDQVSFLVSPYDIITLKIHPTFLELIHFQASLHVRSASPESICNKVRCYVEKGIRKVSSDMNLTLDAEHSLSFYCQDSECIFRNNGPHPASLMDDGFGATLWCELCINDTVVSSPPNGYRVWLGQDHHIEHLQDYENNLGGSEMEGPNACHTSDATSRGTKRKNDHDAADSPGDVKKQKIEFPKLQNLTILKWRNNHGQPQAIRIIQTIAPEWRRLGAVIGLSGSQIRSLAKKYQLDQEDCCRDVFIHWMESPPSNYPVTWEGLCELLEDLEFSQVADTVREALQQN